MTTAVAVVFFGSWGVLTRVWRAADPPLMRIAVATGLLVVLGVVGTFPPVVNAVVG